MARLPQPGSDDGTWGNILNEYLSQTLKADGLLKDNAVTANTLAPNSVTNAAIASDAVNATSIADGSITNALIADGTIQEAKLAASVQTKLNTLLPDASTTVKGKVQLAGDLGGTADSPQVAKIQGIAVSGTPTNGQVLTASSSTAASWVTPTGTLPNLTSGSVPFSNGTTLAQDNGNFFWDGANKRLGIGTNTPNVALHISGASFASSQIQSYAVADNANPVISLRRARLGTTAVKTEDILGGLSWRGHDGNSYGSDAASINVAAVSDFTGSNHGTKINFGVTPVGTISSTTPMALYGDHLDLNYDIASPVGTQVGLNSTISGKGDNASWKGVIAGSFQAKDRSDVDATNKGVLMGLLASVVPNISRNNVPYDDVNGIMVSNAGTGKATDAIYIASHNDVFGGQSEWLTTFTSDANADSGIRLMGNYTYQMLNLSNKLMVDATGSLFMADQSEPSFPTGGGIPSGGGLLYVQSGALKYKQSNGTVTTIANGGQLTSPKIDTINDTNGNPALNFSTFFTGSAASNNVNYFTMYNTMPGGLPRLSPDGPDTNIGMSFVPKGTGEILIWSPSDTPTITGGGPSSNQNLNLKTGGSGLVQANGVAVATISGAQTLTNKTVTAARLGGSTVVPQSGTLTLFNTADETTNYERVRHYWSGNTYNITSENGGTGTNRNIQIATGNRSLLISQVPTTAGIYQFAIGTATAGVVGVGLNGPLTQSSGTFSPLSIQPTITQTSTAGYTALLVNPAETSTGSGPKLLADFQVGGTSYASISNAGVVQARNFAQNTSTRTSATSLGISSAGTNFCDASGGAFTITLPNANATAGLTYIIKKTDSSSNAVTVASAGGTIDGATTYSLASQYKYLKVTSNGTNWFIIGGN